MPQPSRPTKHTVIPANAGTHLVQKSNETTAVWVGREQEMGPRFRGGDDEWTSSARGVFLKRRGDSLQPIGDIIEQHR